MIYIILSVGVLILGLLAPRSYAVTFDQLNEDVRGEVFKYLDRASLRSMSMVDRESNAIAKRPDVVKAVQKNSPYRRPKTLSECCLDGVSQMGIKMLTPLKHLSPDVGESVGALIGWVIPLLLVEPSCLFKLQNDNIACQITHHLGKDLGIGGCIFTFASAMSVNAGMLVGKSAGQVADRQIKQLEEGIEQRGKARERWLEPWLSGSAK